MSCCPVVAAALDRIGLAHPKGWTAALGYRRCPACTAVTVVKDGVLAFAVCAADLPPTWNVDSG